MLVNLLAFELDDRRHRLQPNCWLQLLTRREYLTDNSFEGLWTKNQTPTLAAVNFLKLPQQIDLD